MLAFVVGSWFTLHMTNEGTAATKRLLIAVGAATLISAAAWAIGNLETGCAIAAVCAIAITLRANWISPDD